MTLGAMLEQKAQVAQPVAGHEIVLFRTHSEILTDRRIIVRGSTYPLDQVARAYVRPAWYYAPFVVGRLLMVALTILLLLSSLNVVEDVVPGNPRFHLPGAILIGLAVVMMTWLVPTRVLLIKTVAGHKETVMRGVDAGYLREVRDKIAAAVRSRRQASG
jgi:hypothetical protein